MVFELDITLLAVTFALTVRFAVLAATLPMLDVKAVPAIWRFGLAITLAAALAPAVAPSVPPGAITLAWRPFVTEAFRSLVIGMMLGFTLNLVFVAVRFAGDVAGMQIGFSIVNAFDPMTNSQISVISQFYHLMAVLLFFATGAHLMLVSAMFQSCLALPPFGGGDLTGGAWHLLREFSTVFALGLRIAAPIVIVLLLISAAMGVIVKTVPQLNVLVVGFPIKIGVGLITLGASLMFFKQVVTGMFAGMPDQLARTLAAMQ
ncbi:MAG: flagellar biosynthetic protein FliR [bacterium]|nr:flagellar biosynthetic protein FliR [bacterium]